MKVHLLAFISSALLVGFIAKPALSQQTGKKRWKQVLKEIQRADQGLRSATANVRLEQYVQRPSESKPTLVIKSIGKIWFDFPRYRVELERPNDYLDTRIEQHTIVFDGRTTCDKRTYRDGQHKKIDHGRQLDLPVRFAGFPVADPIRLWKGPLPSDLLKDELAQVKRLRSGGLKTDFLTGGRRVRFSIFVAAYSNRIRHVKVSGSSAYAYHASCDLTWAESNGIPYVQRFVWDSPAGNSEFGMRHKTKRTIEFTDFQAGLAVDGNLFSFASLTSSAAGEQ